MNIRTGFPPLQSFFQLLPGVYFGLILIVPLLSEAGVLFLALAGAWSLVFSRESLFKKLDWQARDSWICLCITSVFLFKLLSSLWSDIPYLAVRNAFWHVHLLLWPLVLIGLSRCEGTAESIERPMAWGLAVTAFWYLSSLLWSTPDPTRPYFAAGTTGYQQLGQLTLVLGTLNFLTLTRPRLSSPRWLFALAFLSTLVILHATSRRIEMAAFALILMACVAYRLRTRLSKIRIAGILAVLSVLMVTIAGLRAGLYAQAFEEASEFLKLRQGDAGVTQTSIGGRLEMYRLAILAIAEKPWFGWGAGIRPHLLGQYGAPPQEHFTHRHFHSEYLQVLVEEGIVWAILQSLMLACLIRQWVLRPAARQTELALRSAAVMLAYALEGVFSSALVYGPSNGLLVVTTCWLWWHTRRECPVSPLHART